MLSKKEAYSIIDSILKHCNYYTMISIDAEEEGLTRFANSEIHQNVFSYNTTVSIKILEGKKESKVTTNLLDERSLKQAVKEAEENLAFLPEGKLEMPHLCEPKEITSEGYDKEVGIKFGITNRSELLKQGIEQLDDAFIAAGSLSLKKSVLAMGNTKGIKRYARVDSVDFNAVVIHEDGFSGYVEMNTNKADELDVVKEFKVAYDKAKLGIDSISVKPGEYTVILEPLAVGDLLAFMSYIGFAARSVQTGMSFLTGKLGQKVFGENITITDDVSNVNTIPLTFDFEGYEKKKLNIIERGIAKELAYDVTSAIKDGVETTGHSVGNTSMGGFAFNLVMENGQDSMTDLIKSTKKGLLVTRFHYMNAVDPTKAQLTALTRDGLYLIEDGEIKTGVKNLRFTESMTKAFSNVVGITKERKKVPGFFATNYVPALKIGNFHFTGNAE
ncbi:MAG: TldD/PmbA family protein [Alkaliphilus sp.]